MRNCLTINSLYDRRNKINELYHFGIIGMHWGIRRFQPYGQGYDADHKGKEVGLAKKLHSKLYARSNNVKEAAQLAKKYGVSASKKVSKGLDYLNYANEEMGKGLKKIGLQAQGVAKTYGRNAFDFGKKYGSMAYDVSKTLTKDLDKRLTEAGYQFMQSDAFSKVYGQTLAKHTKINNQVANIGAIFALRSGINTADKRLRVDKPTSSLGGKSFDFGVMGNKQKMQLPYERELYGKTEFEKWKEKYGKEFVRNYRGSIASRQTSFMPSAAYAVMDDWFTTLSASPTLARTFGIDKARLDALAKGITLTPLGAAINSNHPERMKSLAEGRKLLESSDFMKGDYQDLYGYKFLTKSQQAKLPFL